MIFFLVNIYLDFVQGTREYDYADALFAHDVFLIGESIMAFELSATFYLEYLLILLGMILALYIVLAVAFKRFILPAVLILVVQTAMFVMMSVMAMTGSGIFFLALFIVQAVVKGSTLEWGVLLANSYEEARRTMGKRQALIAAILTSGRVILTSAVIMVVVTGVLGLILGGQEASIMLGMAIATLASAVLTLVVLPALLVVLDRFVVKKNKKTKLGEPMVDTETLSSIQGKQFISGDAKITVVSQAGDAHDDDIVPIDTTLA